MALKAFKNRVLEYDIDVVPSGRARRGRRAFNMEENLNFSTAALESYAFARWEPVIYDAMIVAASIEYADRSVARPEHGWRRNFRLQIPVLEPARWLDPSVYSSLRDAVSFLTGDSWNFDFIKRNGSTPQPPQECLKLDMPTGAVIAFSDGMDSLAVAGIYDQDFDGRLVRVRVGAKAGGRPVRGERIPFASVPYRVTANGESSGRSRGFKFALISGIAAYLSDAKQIIMTESGQGTFGPVLVSTAHVYPDYRSHPLFVVRMERFLSALLKKPMEFSFPRLWSTKGETLKAYVALSGSESWRYTRSCWQDARHSSLNHELSQCGYCAACMLRRLSVHAAGLKDEDSLYICQDLSAKSLKDAFHPDFRPKGTAFREYAIAGTQYLDNMADLVRPDNKPVLQRHAILLAQALELTAHEVEHSLSNLFERHALEWGEFLKYTGAPSFLRQWTRE